MSIRLKRLQSDYEHLLEKLKGNPYIRVKEVHGDPPERYILEYNVKGIARTRTGKVVRRDRHLVEIILTRGYPHISPKCRLLTPIFHPNISDIGVCIGDEWAAAETLAQLAIRIGEIIAYQSYNLKSPVDKKAAYWARRHEKELPSDPRFLDTSVSQEELPGVSAEEITVQLNKGKKEEEVITIHPGELLQEVSVPSIESLQIERCSNCFADSSEVEILTCVEGHHACRNCIIECAICGRRHCLSCTLYRCEHCNRLVCSDCGGLCVICGVHLCREHSITCEECGALVCERHSHKCSACGRLMCQTHIKRCPRCGRLFCVNCASRPHKCSTANPLP